MLINVQISSIFYKRILSMQGWQGMDIFIIENYLNKNTTNITIL